MTQQYLTENKYVFVQRFLRPACQQLARSKGNICWATQFAKSLWEMYFSNWQIGMGNSKNWKNWNLISTLRYSGSSSSSSCLPWTRLAVLWLSSLNNWRVLSKRPLGAPDAGRFMNELFALDISRDQSSSLASRNCWSTGLVCNSGWAACKKKLAYQCKDYLF